MNKRSDISEAKRKAFYASLDASVDLDLIRSINAAQKAAKVTAKQAFNLYCDYSGVTYKHPAKGTVLANWRKFIRSKVQL